MHFKSGGPRTRTVAAHGTGSETYCAGYAYVTTQDGTSRSVLSFFFLRACGWRLRVQPTAIAPYHPIRVARLDSWLKARARSSARVLKVAWRRNRLRSGGWANRHFTEAPTRPTGLDRGRAT